MDERKLYGSLKRLQNFPLDLTCVYETYADAEAYCKKKNSKAYPGQVIAVWNDGKKTSLYLVVKNSDNELSLQGSVNEEDLDERFNILKQEILEKYNELKTENSKLSERLGITEADLTELSKKHDTDIAAINTKVDENVKDLDSRIKEIIDNNIAGDYKDLTEIANWIKQFIGDDGTLGSLGSIANAINNNTEKIRSADEKISALTTRANQTDATIGSLRDTDKKLQASISQNTQAIAAVENKLPITYHGKLSNTTKITEDLTENDEIEEVIINILTADEDNKVSGFKLHIEYADGEDDTLISANSEDNCDYIDITTPGAYKYFLNYDLPTSGAILVDWTDNTEKPVFNASYNVKIIKNIVKKASE